MTAGLREREGTAALEEYRRELTGYCYRMLGSPFDADDAVQETLVKAWQAYDSFEGRSSVRSWLYRIATNVCLDSMRSRGRRALPMDLSSPVPATTVPGEPLPEATWVGPITDEATGLAGDPAEQAVLHDSIRLAFVAALQHLPPRQRAVLLLREVLGWPAADVAELLDTTVASVNSALQRARATMGQLDTSSGVSAYDLGDGERELLGRYVKAFESYDIEGLVHLLHTDATMSMPPLTLWLQGVDDVAAWHLGHGSGCAGSRLIPIVVNGSPGFAQYRADPEGGYVAWSVQSLEIVDGRIQHIQHFLQGFGGRAFEALGLPLRLA
ncbi:sigma-70 family RNA polymerase sigma factor [Motilibacter deserti]|uniref:Sigma-70 family RNA polymerase sigma factor n=1 Tax=Motilibacter deserti TaxID=2714956 RepID=A0ABX0GYC9_9ACTN|nr:sigma-70 family RNA polymerase sigma factor [Motilibacter deserti]NHC14600.1 sigma-70 family RNA polymerase sigma factor [Motilibacter deserti]